MNEKLKCVWAMVGAMAVIMAVVVYLNLHPCTCGLR